MLLRLWAYFDSGDVWFELTLGASSSHFAWMPSP